MRRTHIYRLPSYRLSLADHGEPSLGYCTCAHPDVAPVGGWWPVAFTCCHACSKPRL